MTIYSQHRTRGKVQILATYRRPTVVLTSTVTSLETSVLADPIIEALNWISTYATAPISAGLPMEHLRALTDAAARADLLRGTHSLWYEAVKTLLHHALSNLDDALVLVPPPVRTAVAAELAALSAREYEHPFVAFLDSPGVHWRAQLDELQRGISAEQLSRGVADLRVLLDAHANRTNFNARLLIDDFSITDDPWTDEADGHYLSVEAPMPNGAYDRHAWRIEVCRWEPDDPDDPDSDATGVTVLRCSLFAPPTAAAIVDLLERSGAATQLAVWARTPVGEVLEGTDFMVTERFSGGDGDRG